MRDYEFKKITKTSNITDNLTEIFLLTHKPICYFKMKVDQIMGITLVKL